MGLTSTRDVTVSGTLPTEGHHAQPLFLPTDHGSDALKALRDDFRELAAAEHRTPPEALIKAIHDRADTKRRERLPSADGSAPERPAQHTRPRGFRGTSGRLGAGTGAPSLPCTSPERVPSSSPNERGRHARWTAPRCSTTSQGFLHVHQVKAQKVRDGFLRRERIVRVPVSTATASRTSRRGRRRPSPPRRRRGLPMNSFANVRKLGQYEPHRHTARKPRGRSRRCRRLGHRR